MQYTAALLLIALGSAAAFAPTVLPMGLRQRTAVSRVGGLRMGGDKLPPGPEGRGPFDASDTFVLPDGRSYTPGDACTDDIYGKALEEPVQVGDDFKMLALGAGVRAVL